MGVVVSAAVVGGPVALERSLAEGSVEVVLEALGRFRLELGHDLLAGQVAGYHLRDRDGRELLDVGALLALALEWDPVDAGGLGVACAHEDVVGALGVWAPGCPCGQVAADDLLLPLDDLHLERVAPAGRRALGRHAEVDGREHPALVGDGELLYGLAPDADGAGHLLRLCSLARCGRDLRLLDVVDADDLAGYPARGPGLHVPDGVPDRLAAGLVDRVDLLHELLKVFDLHGDGAAGHQPHLLPGMKKPPGAAALDGVVAVSVLRFFDGRPPGVCPACGGCPTVVCIIQDNTGFRGLSLALYSFSCRLVPFTSSASRTAASSSSARPCILYVLFW